MTACVVLIKFCGKKQKSEVFYSYVRAILISSFNQEGGYYPAKICVTCPTLMVNDSERYMYSTSTDPNMIWINSRFQCKSGFQYISSVFLEKGFCISSSQITELAASLRLSNISTGESGDYRTFSAGKSLTQLSTRSPHSRHFPFGLDKMLLL